MTTPAPTNNPFGGSSNAPLPGGGGSYLGVGSDKQPARHIVLLEKLSWKPPGFKATQGAAIADFQILATDTDNHKVGATYCVYHGFDKSLGKGNCVVDLAGYRSVVLGRPVMPAEITDGMLAAAFGVAGFSLKEHDPDVYAVLGEQGYRGTVLVAVAVNKPIVSKPGAVFTLVTFHPLNDGDITKIRNENPDLYAQMFPAQATG